MSDRLLDSFSLKGRTALVTGGSTGMGYEFARILSEAGAVVMIAARRKDRLEQAADKITKLTGNKVHCCQVDLVDRDQAVKLVEHAISAMGALDIFVGNAAIESVEPIEAITEDSYDALLAVNLTSNVFITKTLIPKMRERGWGRIIYISSGSAQAGLRNLPIAVYAATKSALEGFSRFAAVSTATDGITVNCLSPGPVETEMLEQAKQAMGDKADEFVAYQVSTSAMNRWAKATEIAGTLLLLASDAGSFITGEVVRVDGGLIAMGDSHI